MRKLLLADDSITIHKVIELILSGEGFEIMTTSNGEDALAAIPTFNPDIVLADVEMPKMNGYTLCEKIKEDPSTSRIPVLLLAGAFEPFEEESIKKVRADGFVVKPFDAQELINKIYDAIASSVSAREETVEIPQSPPPGEAVEEDLWAMEEITGYEEIDKILPEEEVKVEEDVYKASEEIGVAHGKEREKETPTFIEDALPAEEAGILEAELPTKDELKEIFEKNLNNRMSLLFSSLDIKEIMSSSLMPILQKSIDKIVNETKTDLSDRIFQTDLKGIFEETINTKITKLLSSIDIKEAVISLLTSLMKEPLERVVNETVPDLAERVLTDALKTSVESLTRGAEQLINKNIPELTETTFKDTLTNSFNSLVRKTEKTVNDILPELIEKTLREELKVSFESIKKEAEKVIWKTIPDLAESVIMKEIERIRSEF